ncbi:MAG: hypothetical protein NQU46_03415 [Methanolinea sp.]|nr:hypothetical protein [Methanolinea sp.]
MEVSTPDIFLLFVILILTGIILFLSLISVIYTLRLAQKVENALQGTEGRTPGTTGAPPVRGPVPGGAEKTASTGDVVIRPPGGRETFDPVRDAPDIPSGMQRLCHIYGLDSLTLSSPDGLVVASSGHPSAIDEAARVSYAYMTGGVPEDDSARVFTMDYKGNPLIGIMRPKKNTPDPDIPAITRDLSAILKRWI